MTEYFGVVTWVGRIIFLGVSHAAIQRGGAPASPIFMGPYQRRYGLAYSDEFGTETHVGKL